MGIRLIQHLFSLAFKNDYIHRYAIIFEILSVNITLIIYYYTSKTFDAAISGPLSQYKMNYFSYLIIGELLLVLPLFFFEGTFRKVKQGLYDGVWQTMNLLPISPLRAISFLTATALPKEFIRIIATLFFAVIFFGLRINPLALIFTIFLVLITSPIFFALGLMFSSLLIKTGRGQALMGYLLTFLSIGAGGFFPIAVLPEFVQKLLLASPYTVLLESSRKFLADGDFSKFKMLGYIIPWYLLIPIGLVTFKKVLSYKGRDLDAIVLKV